MCILSHPQHTLYLFMSEFNIWTNRISFSEISSWILPALAANILRRKMAEWMQMITAPSNCCLGRAVGQLPLYWGGRADAAHDRSPLQLGHQQRLLLHWERHCWKTLLQVRRTLSDDADALANDRSSLPCRRYPLALARQRSLRTISPSTSWTNRGGAWRRRRRSCRWYWPLIGHRTRIPSSDWCRAR